MGKVDGRLRWCRRDCAHFFTPLSPTLYGVEMCRIVRNNPVRVIIPPVSDFETISRTAYVNYMRNYAVIPVSETTPLDGYLRLADKAYLDKIAPELVYPADWYVNEIWDCDDYAMQAQCDAGRRFGVNGIRMALGDTNSGYHAFLVTFDRRHIMWLLEPNSGY